MKRRDTIQQTVIAVAGGLALSACSRSQSIEAEPIAPEIDTVRWRMATSWPKSLDIIFGAAELFCQTLSSLTDGKFVITPYESGELAPGLEVLDAVMAGDAECGHTSSHYYLSKNSALVFAATLPFGLNAQQRSAWLIQGGGLEAIRNVFRALDVINFPCGNTGTQMGGWFNQEITSVSDFQGLRMRLPGLGGQIVSRLGADVQSVAPDKIIDALIANDLDAVEWIGPYDDEKLGLDQAARYYYYPGWWSPAETVDLVVNLEQWNALPKAYQEAFQSASSLVNQFMLTRYTAENSKALQRIQSRGTETKPFSTEIMQRAQAVALELYADLAADSAEFSKIYDSWQQFRQQIQQWYNVNELSFVNFAYANL